MALTLRPSNLAAVERGVDDLNLPLSVPSGPPPEPFTELNPELNVEALELNVEIQPRAISELKSIGELNSRVVMDLRSIAAMTSEERDAYLSIPENFERAMSAMQNDLRTMTPEEMMQITAGLDDNPICEDASGRVLCERHKREICQICCTDQRVGNVLRARFKDREPSEADIAAVQAGFYAESDAFHAAMRARGLQVVGGTQRMQDLFDEFTGGRWKPQGGVKSTTRMPVHTCAACGAGGFPESPLQVCSRCRSVSYCSIACQKRAWKAHKPACRPPEVPSSSK